MKTILRFALYTLAVLGAVWLSDGVRVANNLALVLFAFALGVINWAVKPILSLLTLPITLVTLGLWLLVLNGFMVWLASALVPGIAVKGLWSAIWFSLVLSLLSWAISKIFGQATAKR
jgi:putative membrane protein